MQSVLVDPRLDLGQICHPVANRIVTASPQPVLAVATSLGQSVTERTFSGGKSSR
jgi:hypothetical protein